MAVVNKLLYDLNCNDDTAWFDYGKIELRMFDITLTYFRGHEVIYDNTEWTLVKSDAVGIVPGTDNKTWKKSNGN